MGAWWGYGGVSQMDGLCSCPSETHPIDTPIADLSHLICLAIFGYPTSM